MAFARDAGTLYASPMPIIVADDEGKQDPTMRCPHCQSNLVAQPPQAAGIEYLCVNPQCSAEPRYRRIKVRLMVPLGS